MPTPREVLRKLSSPGAVLILGVVLVVLGAKFLLIQNYGSDLPFWDQWDAEADRLYIPAAEGRLHAAEFFAPHNEHHIVFTKLLAFTLLKLNGQWDARLQMTVNACLHVAAIALLLASIKAQTKPHIFLAAALLAIPLFGLPFTWENTLAGFQSQFYFLLLFSILHLGGTFLAAPGSTRVWLAQITGACAVFAMASGFFSAAIVFAILVTRCCIRRNITGTEAVLIGWNGLLIFTGLTLKTRVPGHEALKSGDLSTFLTSFSLLAAWPSPWAVICPLTLVPFVASIVRLLRKPNTGPSILFVLALGGWWLLQVIAIAYARGGDAHGVAPRYFDTLAVGTLIALILWFDVVSGTYRNAVVRPTLISLFALWLLAVGLGFRFQTEETFRMFLNPLTEVNPRRIETVANFVATKDRQFYQGRPWLDLPYPNAERLGRILSNKDIQSILPSSVRPSLRVTPNITGNTGFARDDHPPKSQSLAGRPAWSSFGRASDALAFFRSAPIPRPHARFLRLSVTGQLSASEGTLYLETPAHRYEVEATPDASEDWKSILIESPDAPFRIVAECKPGNAFAFTEPVEIPLGSYLAQAFLKTGSILDIVGLACVLGALALIARAQVSRR